MNGHQQDVLEALKFECAFLDRGGYGRSVREPRKAMSIFQDTPSCPNYAAQSRTHACADCFLISFVPQEKRGEAVPCHHIPLNDRGDTVSSLAGPGDDVEVQRALRGWVRKTIDAIEKAKEQEIVQDEAPFFVF